MPEQVPELYGEGVEQHHRVDTRYGPTTVTTLVCDQCNAEAQAEAAIGWVEVRRAGAGRFGDPLGYDRTFCSEAHASEWLMTLG